MLRAQPWTAGERTKPYVCNICRHGNPYAASRSQLHRPWLLSIGLTTHVKNSSTALSAANAHYFSTTRTLRNSNNNDGQQQNNVPRGFANLSVNQFGGFGVKKETPAESNLSDGLLPHEREARAKTNVNPPPPSAINRRANQAGRPSKVNRGQQRNGAQSDEHRAQADKSRSLLKNIFLNADGRRDSPSGSRRTENDASKGMSDSNSTAPGQTHQGIGRSASSRKPTAWGSFSNQRPQTQLNDKKPANNQKPFNNRDHGRNAELPSWGAPNKRHSETDRPSRSNAMNSRQAPGGPKVKNPAGQDAWDAMTKHRKDSRASGQGTNSKAGGEDFWGELETRVTGYQQKIKSTPKAAPPEPIVEWMPTREKPDQTQPARRKSRFEEEESYTERRAKKLKQRRGGAQRRGYDEGDAWDDAATERWEQKQRRKEEKKLQKQKEQEAQGPTPIFLPEFINVNSLAQALNQKVDNFLHDLEEMGFEDMTNDTILTGDTAALIAMEYGFEPTVDTGSRRDLRPKPVPDDMSSLPPRPPIVTIMGHVDHGKTTLLDWLRKSSVAAQEHGGITQHIGAFTVKMSSGKAITFLDTPGHAAFLTMRQRGANVTDIVVLVVAADDSVKPQTLEALKHAQAANVPIIVAINKIDKEDARIEQVKADLSRHGVEIEDYGGDVQVVPVSGKTGQGMEDLEENIVTLSEILDVRAEANGMAEGWVLESSVKQNGKIATVLVKRGTLRPGDMIVAGKTWARIRLLRNEAGVEVSEAPPGAPVEIIGWRELPDAGEQVLQAPDEDKAKEAVEYRQEMADIHQTSIYLAEQQQRQREKEAAEAAADAEDAENGEEKPSEPGTVIQNYTVKADVAGSVEAVCGSIMELGNNEVRSRIMRSGAGQITEYDIDHAAISKAIIVNFNLAIQPHIRQRAEEAGVKILDHRVIYHVVDEVRETLSDLLPPRIVQRVQGEADVLQIFSINIKKKIYKNIAGCKIRNGSIKRTSLVKVLRRGEVIFDGAIDTLKHVKKDVMEMGKGTECGIGFEGFEDLQVDDQVQTYEVIKEKRHL